MAKGDELKGFLKAQQAKATAREHARNEEAMQQNMRRQAALVEALNTVMTVFIPAEVREYATATIQATPPRVELNIPGCRPIWIIPEGGGIWKATVNASPAEGPVWNGTLATFPLSNVDDLADVISAAVIDSSPAPLGR